MPFDINNAEPVADVPVAPTPPKFNLQNAEVVDENVPIQHTFRESTNTTVAAPVGLSAQDIEDFDDLQNHNPSGFEKYFLDPAMRGAINAEQGLIGALSMTGVYDDKFTAERLMKYEGMKHKFTAPENIKKGTQAIMESKTFGSALKNIVKHPAAFENLMLESLTTSAPGVALGATLGPLGMIGRAAGFGTGSGITEYGAGLLDLMNKHGIDMTDETSVRGALADPEFMKDAQSRGMKRGVIIGMVDAISAGMAGKLTPTANRIINNATEVAAQAASGAGGEAAAQLATDGDITSPADVLLEGLAETISGIPEIALGREGARPVVRDTETESGSTVLIPEGGDAAVDVPVDGAIEVLQPTDTRTLFSMTEEDLDVEISRQSMSDDDKLVEALGEENAKLFKKLDRQQNSMNTEVADRAYEQMQDLTANLTPEQERLIYGIGEPETAQVDDYKELKQAHQFSTFHEDDPIDYIAGLTAKAMVGVDPIAVMNVPKEGGSIKEQAAFIRIAKGIKTLRDRGVSKEEIAQTLVDGMEALGNTRANAAEIVGNFMATVEASATPRQEQVQIAGGAGGMLPPPPTDTTPSASPDEGPAFIDEEADTRAQDYATVATTQPPAPPSNLSALTQDIKDTANDWFVPMSTRLGKIHESLKHAVRQYTFRTGLHTAEDKKTIQPFIEGVSGKMSEADYRILDLALKNRDTAKVNELMEKYKLTSEWKAVQDLLAKIHGDATEAGMELGLIEDYFPRRVKRGMAPDFIAFLRGQKEYTLIEQAMEQEGLVPEQMTAEEKAEFANLWLRGYKNDTTRVSRTGNTKERSIDYVTPEMNRFYDDSMPTLIGYVTGMRHGIETHKLFGKSATDVNESIGAYVTSLIDQGIIKPAQEQEVRTLLAAVVNPRGTTGLMSSLKNATYIYTMGSPISALTQLGDLAFSLYRNGYYQTGKSLLKAATGRASVKREDVGITDILQEFEDESSSGRAVRKVFSAVGLARMDKFGKEVLMDGAVAGLRKAASKPTKAFTEQMEMVFGDEAAQVMEDLKNGTMSENVRYLAYSELSDFQPVSIVEMPKSYATSGNGRIFYMLKSYTIKQIDVYRREVFSKLASGDIKQTAGGMKNMVMLGSALMLMGMSSDALKDFFLGREIELDDLVMDNILKTMGFTKYQIYTSQKDGFFRTITSTLFTPAAPLDDVTRDVYDLATDEKDLDEVRSVAGVPLVGKFYYWWLGAGTEKE